MNGRYEYEVLGCMPITESLAVLPGSFVELCTTCSTGVWVSLEMKPHVVSGRMKVKCLHCLSPLLKEGSTFALHPDQIEGLRAYGLLDFSQETIARINRDTSSWDGYLRPHRKKDTPR